MDGIVVVVVDVSGKWNEVGGVGVGKKKTKRVSCRNPCEKLQKKKIEERKKVERKD